MHCLFRSGMILLDTLKYATVAESYLPGLYATYLLRKSLLPLCSRCWKLETTLLSHASIEAQLIAV